VVEVTTTEEKQPLFFVEVTTIDEERPSSPPAQVIWNYASSWTFWICSWLGSAAVVLACWAGTMEESVWVARMQLDSSLLLLVHDDSSVDCYHPLMMVAAGRAEVTPSASTVVSVYGPAVVVVMMVVEHSPPSPLFFLPRLIPYCSSFACY
jgi:hypothetical protein